jgi:hypothetical protein
MKIKNITSIIILIIVLMQLACTETKKKADEINYNSLDWIIGNWVRTNDEPCKTTFENWLKITDFEYVGEGFTIAENDTIFKENLKLILIDDIWNLEVTGVNESPTYFQFINHTENSFTCENKLNEFPKIIDYSFSDNILKAKISDDTNEIVFLFEKIKI